MAEEWWSPEEIVYSREQVIFLLKHLSLLRAGCWPGQPVYDPKMPQPKRYKSVSVATARGIAWAMDKRLEETGLDGLLAEASYGWSKDVKALAKSLMPVDEVRERIDKAISYISGYERKRLSYEEFCR